MTATAYLERVTVELLTELGACSDQLERFTELYPGGLDVTPETAVAAREAGLDVDWLLVQTTVTPDIYRALGWTVYEDEIELEEVSGGKVAVYGRARIRLVSGGEVITCAQSQPMIETVSGGVVGTCAQSQPTIETVSGGEVITYAQSHPRIETVSGGMVSTWAQSQPTIETVSGGMVRTYTQSQPRIETVSGGVVSDFRHGNIPSDGT